MPALSDEQCLVLVEFLKQAWRQGAHAQGVPGAGRSVVELASEMAVAEGWVRSGSSFRTRFDTARRRGFIPDYMLGAKEAVKPAPSFTVAHPPQEASKTTDQIIAERVAAFQRKKAGDNFRKAIDVEIHEDGPIGLCFFGDPHLDNDGTNWPLLQAHLDAVKKNPTMFACSVGDYRDNWVGRLTSIYGHGGAKVTEAVELLEWFTEQVPWLALSSGNHDSFGSIHGDVLALITKLKNVPGPYGQDDMRLALNMPNGARATVRMRHRFPGNSMYSPGHGAAKEALLGARDHVLAAGDIHSADLRTIWHESEQRLCIGLQVGSYKQIDDYAIEKGFRPVNWTPNMAVIIDPAYADDPLRFITAFWDLEEACDFLTWKRERFSASLST